MRWIFVAALTAESGHVADGGCRFTLEIKQDHLPVQRLEPVDPIEQPRNHKLLIRSGLAVNEPRFRFERVEVYQPERRTPPAHDVGRSLVVGHSIDPGLQAATTIKQAEAPPELDVDVL